MDRKLSKEEILECITRSGYLLESRLVKTLNESGYFVDPNQVILDPITGKSREIDLVAEIYPQRSKYPHIVIKTHFVIEAINNLYPLVLTTKRPWTPNTLQEEYVQYKADPEDEIFKNIEIWEEKFQETRILYSQYCAITKKKNNELMACHTDDLYSSFSKLVQYCTSIDPEFFGGETLKKYWRAFFWQPILVLQGDLYILEESECGRHDLVETEFASLEFNYHKCEVPCSIAIDIVTESYLLEYMNKITQKDLDIQNKLGLERYGK